MALYIILGPCQDLWNLSRGVYKLLYTFTSIATYVATTA